MKTRKIISTLRVVAERTALVMVIMLAVVFIMRQYTLCMYAQNHWYLWVALISCYVALTLGEDYLNWRFFLRRKQ